MTDPSAIFNGNSRQRRYHSRTSASTVLNGIDLTGKTALITGTNSGIGIETARWIAMSGAHVVMANRNIVASEELKRDILNNKPDAKIDIIVLDLSSLQSVKAAANEYLSKGWPLHLLILNAGVFGPTQKTTLDNYESSFGVNHLGHFYLTQLLLPKLRESRPGRIVVVASHSHRDTGIDPSLPTEEKLKRLMPAADTTEIGYRLYAYSKLCNVLFAFALHRKEHSNGINVYVLHPGTMIGTGIARNYGVLGKVFNVVTKPFTKTLEQGAATTVYCAADPELDNNSGRYFESCWDDEKHLQTALARDEALQDALWHASEELLQKYESGRR
uniref:Uncharacterized protein n=1 Tax=Plectus sambesii TaxID=2011161 RepID=A0A914W822_9BILA